MKASEIRDGLNGDFELSAKSGEKAGTLTLKSEKVAVEDNAPVVTGEDGEEEARIAEETRVKAEEEARLAEEAKAKAEAEEAEAARVAEEAKIQAEKEAEAAAEEARIQAEKEAEEKRLAEEAEAAKV